MQTREGIKEGDKDYEIRLNEFSKAVRCKALGNTRYNRRQRKTIEDLDNNCK